MYDALSNDYLYRPALPEDQVMAIMTEYRGRHFDPEIHAYFLKFFTVSTIFRILSLIDNSLVLQEHLLLSYLKVTKMASSGYYYHLAYQYNIAFNRLIWYFRKSRLNKTE